MLTIYIPTYNRFKHLKLLLTSLFIELDENPSIANNVFIKIFNNSSFDGTQKYLSSIVRNNLYIYNRIDNIGARKNQADAILNCDTDYLWILGDDDIPYHGLLTKIVHGLRNQSPELLYLPPVWYLDVFDKSIPSISSGLIIEKKNPEQFIKLVGTKLTFMSAFVFSFRHYSSFKNNNDVNMARETDFMHLAFYSPAILSGKSLFVMSDVVICATGNSNFQYSMLQVFGIDLPNIVRRIFATKRKLSDLIIKNLIIAYLPSFIYSIKFGSSKSLDKSIPWNSLQEALGRYKLFWVFIFPLKYFPKILAIPIVLFGRFFR